MTLLPLVSKVVVAPKPMPPTIAPAPELMSVVAPVAQRIVPPLLARPPRLAPKLAEILVAVTWSTPVEASEKPPEKVFAPVRETEEPTMATLLFVVPVMSGW